MPLPLIDHTYFSSELAVGSLSQEEIFANFNAFILKYERKFLYKILGQTLADEFLVEMAKPEVDIIQKWKDLRAKLVNPIAKESPIANYVWFYYVRDLITQQTGTGNASPTNENSILVNPIDKTTRAWNEMVSLNYSFYDWISGTDGVYGELPYTFGRCHMGRRNELYVRLNTLNV